MSHKIKPLVKWVGGKRDMIPELLKHFPKVMEAYHEPFVGGGSVLLALLREREEGRIVVRSGKICAYDANETLIHMYLNVQRDPAGVYKATQRLGRKNKTTNSTAKEDYYKRRQRYNAMTQTERNGVEGTALFLYLNRMCYGGLYREGPNGFNVSFGNHRTSHSWPPTYDDFSAFSRLIRNVTFLCSDFRHVFSSLHSSTSSSRFPVFVFLDPPYVPLSLTASFSVPYYTHNGFSLSDHLDLFSLLLSPPPSTKKTPLVFLMSNSPSPWVLHFFQLPVGDIPYSSSTLLVLLSHPL